MLKLPRLPDEPPAYKPLIRFSVALAGFVLSVWTMLGFLTNSNESYVITNGAVALLLASSGICFSFARALNDVGVADRILFAGERLFHGSLLIALSTAMRYLIFHVAPNSGGPLGAGVTLAIVMSVPMLLVMWVFTTGVLFASTGVRVITDVVE